MSNFSIFILKIHSRLQQHRRISLINVTRDFIFCVTLLLVRIWRKLLVRLSRVTAATTTTS